jgi:dipeptidyl aminopeptidase/acylaminoacyl peptidase
VYRFAGKKDSHIRGIMSFHALASPFLVLAAATMTTYPVRAGEWAEALSKRLKLQAEALEVGGRPAFILPAAKGERSKRQPWILYAPALADYPDKHEAWLHQQFVAAGVTVAGVDVGEAYGSPRGRAAFDALYKELVERRGFAPKPSLLGRSRGGLWVVSWAADHPDQVAGIAGIYPAFDLRTYPGLEKAASAYELTVDELQLSLNMHNPIARVTVLAKARVPAFFIHGEDDAVVPLKENSAEFVARYKAVGAEERVTLQVIKGQGHNFWPGFFQSQELVDFAIARAKDGAK